MDTFFNYLRKTLVGTVAILFAFVVLYTPQNFVHEAEAGAAYGGSAIAVQSPQFANETINSVTNLVNTVSTLLDELKSYVLDGLAWDIMKRAVIGMADSMVKWINNGFEGRPQFVQNIEEFLRDQADAALGEYIQNLGELGSFLCDPFKLDVSIALTIALDNRHQPAPTCTLTEIVDNFDDFSSGARGSFSAGGWDDWFDITSNPETNTAFGALGTARLGSLAVIADTRMEEGSLLNFANGFLSMRQCEKPEGEGATTKCSVGTPGKIIQEALSNNLDTNRQIMVEADEFNELLTGFLGMMANSGENALFKEFVSSSNSEPTASELNRQGSALEAGRTRIDTQVETIKSEGEETASTTISEVQDEIDEEKIRADEDWKRERQQMIDEAVARAEAARRAAEEAEGEGETP